MTPFAVFFLRQFFLGISRELEEAARIDGAGHVRIFFRIIVADERGAVTTLAILTYITVVERLLLAPAGRQGRERPRAHRRPRRVPVADPPGWPGLGRPHGRHAASPRCR